MKSKEKKKVGLALLNFPSLLMINPCPLCSEGIMELIISSHHVMSFSVAALNGDMTNRHRVSYRYKHMTVIRSTSTITPPLLLSPPLGIGAGVCYLASLRSL